MNSEPIHSSLSESGRAGFVMANSAADARASELEIRSQIIKSVLLMSLSVLLQKRGRHKVP